MLKNLLKFIFATGLLFWLITSGRLDFSLINKAISLSYFFPITIVIILCQISLGILRFRNLLRIKTKKEIHFFDIAKIHWIGLFFSSILPGAVTGDIIKLVYVKKIDSQLTKTFLITTALIDRILGLSGLLFLSGLSSLIYYREMILISPKMKSIILINLLLFLGTVIFFLILFSSKKIKQFVAIYSHRIPFVGKKIFHVLEQIFSLSDSKAVIVKCFFISICIQFLSILAFYTITHTFYSSPIGFPQVFTFIPIGLIAVAIPISPGGLGVGHALFQNLFALIQINNGASLFNLFFLCNISIGILGIIPYLLIGSSFKNINLED